MNCGLLIFQKILYDFVWTSLDAELQPIVQLANTCRNFLFSRALSDFLSILYNIAFKVECLH